jgi:hypothetical protein
VQALAPRLEFVRRALGFEVDVLAPHATIVKAFTVPAAAPPTNVAVHL